MSAICIIGVIGSLVVRPGVSEAHFIHPLGAAVSQSFGAANATNSTSLTASTATATGGSDLLVAAVRTRGSSTVVPLASITDSAGNTWTKAASVTQGARSDGEIWYSAGAHSVVSVSVQAGASASLSMTVLDLTGASSLPLDQTATAAGDGQAARTGTTGMTSQASEIAVAVIGWNGTPTVAQQSAGFTETPTFQSTARSNASGEQAAYSVLTASAAQSYAARFNSSQSWTGLIATFRMGSPQPPPLIGGFSPTHGVDGTAVVITGMYFTGATAVAFNGVFQTILTVDSDTQISTTVPSEATTGPLSVVTGGGTVTSTATFTVDPVLTVPSLTRFEPVSGPVGTVVTVYGSGLGNALSVNIGGVNATIASDTDTELRALVGGGASSGAITVTTANGTADTAALSPSAFTITTMPTSAHVLVIMEENKGYAQTLGACSANPPPDPYLCSLASTYASDTAWYGVTHPSAPDYVAIDSGSTQGVTTDCVPTACGPFNVTSFGGQLTAAGIPWVDYQETMPSACFTGGSSGKYTERHNPFMYFNDVRIASNCAQVVLPYPGASALVTALDAPGAPDFVWITPNLLDDMHSTSVAQGDAWLQANLSGILGSSWFADNGTVIITMDENSYQQTPAGGLIPEVIISATAKGVGTVPIIGNHYGTLRTLEDAYGLPYLGAASDAANGDLGKLIG